MRFVVPWVNNQVPASRYLEPVGVLMTADSKVTSELVGTIECGVCCHAILGYVLLADTLS